MSPLTVEDLVSVYVTIRDRKRELEASVAEQVKELDEELSIIASALLDACKDTGADSIRTKSGTVIRSVKSKYWTNDWESMWAFIRDNNAMELLEKRIHQTNMKQFLEENQDKHPAGLNIDSEFTITVRKK
jgi:hypothetical protein